MKLVRRARLVDVEAEEAKEGAGSLPIERIVDEGLLIALSAVRMAVKNDIIVGALRDNLDYEPARYALATKAELHVLSRQNVDSAIRVSHLRKAITKGKRSLAITEDQRKDLSQFALRRRVHKLLAVALDEVADDDERVARIVADAQLAAVDEIRNAVSARLIRLAVDPRDPDYEERRPARLEMLLLVDLNLLQLAHAEASGFAHNEY